MIRRDGQMTSLWQSVADAYQPVSEAIPGQAYDVIVVGAGITGITTALSLQEAGKKCLVVEAVSAGFGTTGGTTAHLNTYVDSTYTTIEKNFDLETAQLVAKATAGAIAMIRHNVERFRIDCEFSNQPAFLFAQDEKEAQQLAEDTVAAMNAGLTIQATDSIPCPIPFTSAVRVGGQAQFNPIRYLFSIAKAYEDAGGTIIQGCRVENVSGDGPVTVETSVGKFTCNDLIYATHIPPGINLLHLRCAPWRSYAIAVKLGSGQYPQGLVYDMKDPYNYYRSQVIDGEDWLIVGGKDHKTGDDVNTEACFVDLESMVRRYYDVKEVGYKWSSQYFESSDGLPYIGLLPGGGDHIYVATGYGGNGMVYGTVAARVLKALITDSEEEISTLFTPSRVKPVAGFTNFLSHNAHVAKSLVEGLFSADKMDELAALAPGEAGIVQYDGRKLGLFKDEQGKIHAVNPTCTHMKCNVNWNAAEQSWDCPCHGARYDMDGKVLTGPADRDLPVVKVEERSSVGASSS
ncbi:MAG: FAD-dependent oxidoreductase [Chitinophagaceae bacterium]|nr:MAG: FAD-dependent oxidoreductase [Chitinophagaceae bacterium]